MFPSRALVFRAALIAVLAFPLAGLASSALCQDGPPEQLPMIYGRVTHLTGGILPGVTVELTRYRGSYLTGVLEKEVAYRAETDYTGEFAFHRIPTDVYFLRAKSPGFNDAVIPELYAHENQQFVADVALDLVSNTPQRPVKVQGLVVNEEGEAVQEASVLVLTALNQSVVHRGRTDQEGRFEIKVYGPFSFVLIVNRPGYQSASESVYFDRDGTRPLRVTLKR